MNPEDLVSEKGKIKYVWQGRGIPQNIAQCGLFFPSTRSVSDPSCFQLLFPSLQVMVFLPLKSSSVYWSSNQSVTVEMWFLVNKKVEKTTEWVQVYTQNILRLVTIGMTFLWYVENIWFNSMSLQ